MHPQKPDVLFAASYERRRRAWNFEEGGAGSRIHRSTDAGATWEVLDAGLPGCKLGRIGLVGESSEGEAALESKLSQVELSQLYYLESGSGTTKEGYEC